MLVAPPLDSTWLYLMLVIIRFLEMFISIIGFDVSLMVALVVVRPTAGPVITCRDKPPIIFCFFYSLNQFQVVVATAKRKAHSHTHTDAHLPLCFNPPTE